MAALFSLTLKALQSSIVAPGTRNVWKQANNSRCLYSALRQFGTEAELSQQNWAICLRYDCVPKHLLSAKIHSYCKLSACNMNVYQDTSEDTFNENLTPLNACIMINWYWKLLKCTGEQIDIASTLAECVPCKSVLRYRMTVYWVVKVWWFVLVTVPVSFHLSSSSPSLCHQQV